jgi:Transposase IS116/IS110/IS902 family
MIERVAKRYPDVEVISQINGVGTLTALVFLLTIEDKNRFAKSRMVGPYLGLRPRKRQSCKGDPQLRITKAGDPFVRRLVVIAANYIYGAVRQGQRLAALGAGTGQTWRQECKETSQGRGGQKTRGADAPTVGHRRGVRASGLPVTADGRDTSGLTILPSSRLPCTGSPGLLTLPTHATRPGPPAQGPAAHRTQPCSAQPRLNSEKRPQEVERPNRPRPGDCVRSLEPTSSKRRCQHPFGSDPNMHRAPSGAPRRVRMEARRCGVWPSRGRHQRKKS